MIRKLSIFSLIIVTFSTLLIFSQFPNKEKHFDAKVMLASEKKIHSRVYNKISHASVTEVNVKNFGAIGNGKKNDTLAIQKAINSIKSGIVIIPEGKYIINHLNLKSNVILSGKGKVELIPTNQEYATGAIRMYGSKMTDQFKLYRNAKSGSRRISLSIGAGKNFKSGDYIYLQQNDPLKGNLEQKHSQSYLGALLEIENVYKDTIIITEPLAHSFQVGNKAWIQKVNPIVNSEVKGLKLNMSKTGKFTHGFEMKFAVNSKVSNVQVKQASGKGVQILKSRHFNVDGVIVENPRDVIPAYGYAVFGMYANHGKVTNVTGIKTRHTIDFANGSYNIEASNSVGRNNETAAFSTHGQNNKNITFKNNTSYGGMYGFAIGNSSYYSDTMITLENNKAYDAKNSCYFYGIGSTNGKLKNNYAENCLTAFNILEAKQVSMENSKVVKSWRGISIDKKSDGITIKNSEIKGTIKENAFVVARGSQNITLDNLKINGQIGQNAIQINESKNINLNKINIDVNGKNGAIIQNSQNIVFNGITIKGSLKEYGILNQSKITLNQFEGTAKTGKKIIFSK